MSAYWIAHVTVTDPEAYRGYQALAPAAFAAHGARFLARGGAAQTLEGPRPLVRGAGGGRGAPFPGP